MKRDLPVLAIQRPCGPVLQRIRARVRACSRPYGAVLQRVRARRRRA